MNTNKVKCFFLFLISFLILINLNVNAAEDCSKYGCAQCVYNDGRIKFSFDLKSSGNGSAELRFSSQIVNSNSYGGVAYNTSHSLVAKNFINSSNKLVCPQTIYVKYTAGGRNIAVKVLSSAEEGTIKVSLESQENNNLSVVKDGSSVAKSCSYNFTVTGNKKVQVVVTVVDNKLKFDLTDGYKVNTNTNSYDLTPNDFKNSCPKIYGQCGSYGNDKYCSLSKSENFDILDRDEPQQGEDVKEIVSSGDNSVPPSSNIDDTLEHEYVGANFCDEDSVKKILVLVGYIVIFAKIAVPLLLIFLGSLDLYKGVVGKDEKDLTSGLKTFVLRLVAGIIIFFIPTIVNYAFDLIYESAGGSPSHCVTCILDTESC